MGATHDTIVSINILLDPPPADATAFLPLILGDQEDGTTLDGDRLRAYTDAAGVDADEADGFISSYVATAVRRGFSQSPAPGEILVGRVDTDAGEGYDDALTAIEQINDDFYGIAIDSRLPADQIEVAEWAEARDKLFVLQSDDADILTPGFPGDYSAIEDFENTAGLYHDDDERSEDFSWVCNRLAFDPDERSVPWDAPLQASTGYTTPITTTEKGNAEDNNFNLLLPLGPSNTFVANEGVGVNLAGRQISEIFTKHWFRKRLQEAVTAEKVRRSGRGEKIPVSLAGVAIIEPLVNDLLLQGEAADHFVDGQTFTSFPIPTAADIEAARIRGGGSAQFSTSAGEFVFTLIFSRQPVVEEA